MLRALLILVLLNSVLPASKADAPERLAIAS